MVWYKNGTPPRTPNDVLSRRFASASSCARGNLMEYASTHSGMVGVMYPAG